MLKKIITYFRVQKGQFVFLNRNIDDFQKFLEDNEGKKGVREYRIEEEDVKYYQHKYYRGYLIPPIAKECFDNDEYRAHVEMKKMFLFMDIQDYEKIPVKLKARCIPIWKNLDTGEDILIGILPSTGDLSKNDMREYMLKVENFGFEMAMYAITEENKEAIEIRNMALGYDPGQGEMFNE